MASLFLWSAALLPLLSVTAQEVGYRDTPILPGQKWRVHDADRPLPRVITPGAFVSNPPPSDAVVLFDGRDLSKWRAWDEGRFTEPKWPVRDGYFEVLANTGTLVTVEKFGDIQLHLEWASPSKVTSKDQGRGNSGVLLMGRYELQVLDCYNNPTYADGHAGALYGQYPPLVNACRPPGEWQSFDIVFEAPRFDGERVMKPAYFTVFHNGVLIHNHTAAIGQTAYREVGRYRPHGTEELLGLQDHGNPVRFRNIWVRRIRNYDE